MSHRQIYYLLCMKKKKHNKLHENNKSKLTGPTKDDGFERTDRSYFVSDIHQKHIKLLKTLLICIT